MNTKEALQALLDGKKIRSQSWDKHFFIFLHEGMIYSSNGRQGAPSLNYNDFEIYQEPKKMKRFWLWNLKHKEKPWYKCPEYLDDYGMYTSGKYGTIWHELEKQKLENDFIDIEWDGE